MAARTRNADANEAANHHESLCSHACWVDECAGGGFAACTACAAAIWLTSCSRWTRSFEGTVTYCLVAIVGSKTWGF